MDSVNLFSDKALSGVRADFPVSIRNQYTNNLYTKTDSVVVDALQRESGSLQPLLFP